VSAFGRTSQKTGEVVHVSPGEWRHEALSVVISKIGKLKHRRINVMNNLNIQYVISK
jgi:hypothetical protein